MKKLKQSLCWIMTLAMLFSMVAGLVVTAAADTTSGAAKTDAGECGVGVTYEYYDLTPGDNKPSGVLTIKGAGSMTDYELTAGGTVNTPWVEGGYAADIQKVEILSGVTTIGTYAFSDLTSLETVTVESGLTTIKQYAFRNDKALAGNIALPASTKTIESYAFVDCPELLVISTPNASTDVEKTFSKIGNDSVIYVYNAATGDDQALTYGYFANGRVYWRYYPDQGKLLVKPAELGTNVAIPGFKNADATPWSRYAAFIKEIEIGSGIIEIGSYAFANLPRVISVTIPNTVRYIGSSSFRNAVSLPSISFPRSVHTIYTYAFSGCSALVEATAEYRFLMVYPAGNERLIALLNNEDDIPISRPTSGTCGDNLIWNYNTETGELSITGTGVMDSYASTDEVPWSYYTSQIKSITVGEGALLIGKNAFNGAVTLKYVTLPSTLTAIEADAFNDCGSIVTAYIDKEKTAPLVIYTGNTDLESKLTYKDSTSSTTSGVCGEAVSWIYSESSKTLIILGTGSMYNYESSAKTPWASYLTIIEELIVTEGVTTVGQNALNGATSLKHATLASSLTDVKQDAFAGCSALEDAYVDRLEGTVTIDSGNQDLIDVLRYKEVVTPPVDPDPDPDPNPDQGTTDGGQIPGSSLTWTYSAATHALNIKGVGEIPSYTSSKVTPWAKYTNDITAITVQEGITGIGNYAFANMPLLIDVYLPESLTRLGDYVFYNCTSIKTVKLPDALKTMGTHIFENCSSLKVIEIPSRVGVIDDYAFCNCVSLETVILNKGLYRIGYRAFYNCTSLKHIEFPTSLQSIDEEAFYGCSSLESVIISSPLEIGKNAFGGCTSLNKVILDNCDEPTAEEGNDNLVNNYVESEASGTLSNGVIWDVDRVNGTLTFRYEGEGEGLVIREEAWLSEMKFVDTVIFGKGITAIDAGLLKDDGNVEYVSISNSVTTIGDGAFENCQNLERVNFSKNLIYLGKNAFKNCKSLADIALPDTLTVIPEGAFAACSSLTNVTLGKNVTEIGKDAFESCSSLAAIALPASLKTLAEGAFKNCTALEKISLHKGVKPLNKGVFVGCNNIELVEFNGSKAEWTRLVANADDEIKNAKVEYFVSWTVELQYGDGPMKGEQVFESMTFYGKEGEQFTIQMPSVNHYTPDQPEMEVVFSDYEVTVTVKYYLNVYDITIEYVDANGNSVASHGSISLTYGEETTIRPITVPGYTPNQSEMTVNVNEGNCTVQFVYTINQYGYLIEYRNEKTNALLGSEVVSVDYMTDVLLTAADMPAFEYYTLADPDKTYAIENIQDNEQVITVYYTPDSETITIHYVDDNGNKLFEDKVETVYYGEKVSVPSPDPAAEGLAGFMPADPFVIDAYDGGNEFTVTYERKVYTITIHFYEVNTVGYSVFEDFTVTVKHGDDYTFLLADHPEFINAAYTTDTAALDFGAVTGDAHKTIVYTPKSLTLTVEYKDQGEVIKTEKITVLAGRAYTIPELKLQGYKMVAAQTGTMGVEDKTIEIPLEAETATPGGNTQTPGDNTDDNTQKPGGDDDQAGGEKGGAGTVVAVIAIIVLVLVGGGAGFYFLYLKKKPF